MSESEKYYFEIILVEKFKDVEKKLEFFSEMTNCLFDLVNNLFEEKITIKYYQRELESKLYRYGVSNKTIEKIITGNKFNLVGKEVNIIDIDSLYSITRMQIEIYSILYYLIFDKVSDELKDFRYNIYKLHGIQKQHNFEVSPNFVDKENQLEKIKNELDELIEIIKSSEIFKMENVNKQKAFLKPKYAKMEDTKSIFEKSGITQSRIDTMWSIYSNYAHAEHIGDRQSNYRFNNPSFVSNTISLIIDVNKILTSRIIWFLKEEFEVNRSKYNSFTERQRIHVEMWMKL